jgi:CheY-like chemotaxis protein
VRSADQTKHTPIIVLGACAVEPDQQHAPATRCDTFPTTPYLPEQLVSAIHAAEAATLKR